MKTVREVCQYIGSLRDSAICVETGCMYTCPVGNEVHTTTNNIYKYIVQDHGVFYSLDIDPEHLEFARTFCRPLQEANGWHADLYFVEGDSVESLRKIRKKWSGNGPGNSIEVLWLDSKGFDEDHMVNEYLAIKDSLCPERHFVLVDDIHNPNSVKYKKMVPLLKSLGYQYIEVPTPTGLFVAAKGYPLPSLGG